MRRFALAGIGFYLTPQVAWSLFVCPEVSWHLLETAFHFRPDATSGSSSVANRPRFTPLSQKSSHVSKIFPLFSRAHFNHLQKQKGFTSIMYLLSDCPPCPGSLGCQAPASQATPPVLDLLHNELLLQLSSFTGLQVDHSPLRQLTDWDPAASSSSSRNAAGRSAPRGAGGAQAPSIENLGGLSFDPSSGPQILGCPQDFLSTSRILPTWTYPIYCHLWFLSLWKVSHSICSSRQYLLQFFPLY